MDDAFSIVILSDLTHSHEKGKEFLERKNWKVRIANNLRSGVEMIQSLNPGFLLVSINLIQNVKNLKQLAKEMEEKYSCVVVGFADSQDVQSSRLLTGCGLSHIIYPPLTGALIEIKIKKIKLEKDSVQERPKFVRGLAAAPESTQRVASYKPIAERILRVHSDSRIKLAEMVSKENPSDLELAI